MGGFSFGDHIGAGKVFANSIRCRMHEQLEKFMADGKLILGICNGFQTITRLGLVPAGLDNPYRQDAAIAENNTGVFRDAWVRLKINASSPCVFTKGIDYLELPVRHGEGQFLTRDKNVLDNLQRENLDTVFYVDPHTDRPSMEFPHNPNGSEQAIAGICDRSGRIFGLMPHPEAYISPFNHPHWVRQKLNDELPQKGAGQAIFDNAVNFAATELT